jgi:hypothetical protein
MVKEEGTKENPWKLKTPPLSSEFTMHKDVKDGKEILVCTVGKTVLHYDYRCLALPTFDRQQFRSFSTQNLQPSRT